MQQLLGLRAVGSQVRGDDVHVVPGAHRLFLFLDFGPVQVGDLPFDGLDGADLIHRLDVHGHYQAGFHVQEVRQDAVIELRGQDLQEGHRPPFPAHAEGTAAGELQGGRGDEVLGAETRWGQPVPGEAEGRLVVHVEHIVEQPQPLRAVERCSHHPQAFEVVDDVRFDALQPGLGRPDALRLHAKGEVLGLDKAVVAPGELVLEHSGILCPDGVEAVPLGWDHDALFVVLPGGGQIEEGELEADGAVKVVEAVRPPLEDGAFILILR